MVLAYYSILNPKNFSILNPKNFSYIDSYVI